MYYCLRKVLFVLVCVLLCVANTNAGPPEGNDPYTTIANQIVDGFNQRSSAKFMEVLDLNTILDKVLTDLEMGPDFRREFKRGFLGKANQLGDGLLQRVPEDRYVKLLRVTSIRGGAKVLVRFDYGDKGMGYQEFFLKRQKNGKIRIIDWFDFASGLKYTESLKQFTMLATSDMSIIRRFFKSVKGEETILKKIQALVNAGKAKDFAKVCRIYDSFDENLKKHKVLALFNLNAGNMSGNEQLYKNALKHFVKHFGNDPSCSFLLIDHYYIEKNYPKTLEMVNTFSSFLGTEDAALHHLKGNILMEMGRPEKAVKSGEKGVRVEPEYEDNYWLLLVGYVKLGADKKAVRVCRILEENFSYNLTMEYFQQNSEFKMFVKSKAFKEWMRSRGN